MSKLEKTSKETASAWKWVQENMDNFEKEVYGPPIVSCSIKDQRYTDPVEAIFQRNDFLAITAQTAADHQKLSDQLLGTMSLGDVTLRRADVSLPASPPLSKDDMHRFGLQGWALDFVDGPEPVLAMLCGAVKLNSTGISLEDVTEDQHKLITESGTVNSWVTGRHSFRVNRRREYGPGATSTLARTINRGKYWTDQPADVTARREIEERKKKLDADFEEMKTEVKGIRDKIEELDSKRADLVAETVSCVESIHYHLLIAIFNRVGFEMRRGTCKNSKGSRRPSQRRSVSVQAVVTLSCKLNKCHRT